MTQSCTTPLPLDITPEEVYCSDGPILWLWPNDAVWIWTGPRQITLYIDNNVVVDQSTIQRGFGSTKRRYRRAQT